MKRIEDSSMIYYRSEKGIVQDGNEWLSDRKHGQISEKELGELTEVYWSSSEQAWLII